MSVIIKDLIKNYYNLDSNAKFDLEYAIKVLAKQEKLSTAELIVIRMTIEGATQELIALAINTSLKTVDNRLNEASDKISNYLGDSYSDDQIIKKVEQRLGRPLTESELAFCWFMIRFHGRKVNKELNIFNFRIDGNGRFITKGKDKTEG